MWQKLVVVSSHLSERGGCEKNVVKADEQERVTRETQERERDVKYIQNRMNCILDCTSFFSISSSSMYQIPIALHFNSLSSVRGMKTIARDAEDEIFSLFR